MELAAEECDEAGKRVDEAGCRRSVTKLRRELMKPRRECSACARLLLVELKKEEDRRLSCRGSMIPVPRRMAREGVLLILVPRL
jgi:hypothetical protein